MKALVLLVALQSTPVAVEVTNASPPFECTAEEAFGVTFGDPVDKYAPRNETSARSGGRFVSYLIRPILKSSKYQRYTAEADRETREIYSVKAWAVSGVAPPESEYDRVLVPEVRRAADEFSSANGISIPTPGRPPYSLDAGGVEYSVWHDFYDGKLYYTFECLNKQHERAVQGRVLKDLLGGS